jgi:beta-aspartyl-peptidase (threonine type)
MTKTTVFITVGLCLLILLSTNLPADHSRPRFGIVIHGGAGTITPDGMTAEEESAYRTKLDESLAAGHAVLAAGGTALDAVIAAIIILEESPLFNAGRGAVFSAEGRNELDAAIMEGKTRNAGAVTGITIVKSPIRLARAVMEQSDHVFLSGTGAEAFAREKGLEIVLPSYFFTEKRWQQLQDVRRKKNLEPLNRMGTVGAAALDRHGNLAAGTSTGGMTFKRYGRIGDCPIIGAGTYANNETCALSATGHGEYFIRLAVGHEISALMAYKKVSLQEAADDVIHRQLTALGGTGGVVAIDRQGRVAMPFNTAGMFRAYRISHQPAVVAMYPTKAP